MRDSRFFNNFFHLEIAFQLKNMKKNNKLIYIKSLAS